MEADESEPLRGSGGDLEEVPLADLPLHSTNLLTVLDGDGIIRYESPAIERLYGFEPPALLGKPVADFVHPEDRAEVMAAFRSLTADDGYTVEAVEYRHACVDGSYTWVESVGASDPTPAGHYVINTRDVSARRERERRLEAANDRLETFAAMVSHDLRNPLNVAQARVRLAQDECDSAHLAAVADAHDRMATLIEGLLDLARLGREGTDPVPVALGPLCETAWATVATADARLAVETERRIRADRSGLRQVLENLFRNAIEHGGSDVTVTVGELPTGFYVEDDGSGISSADGEHLFEAGASSLTDGTGLGLSIVEAVVTAHDWDVTVTDGSDGGARFELTGVSVLDEVA